MPATTVVEGLVRYFRRTFAIRGKRSFRLRFALSACAKAFAETFGYSTPRRGLRFWSAAVSLPVLHWLHIRNVTAARMMPAYCSSAIRPIIRVEILQTPLLPNR